VTTQPPVLDSRLKRTASASRADRRAQERTLSEKRELSDSDRREAYRKGLYQAHLPDLPPMKGYHVCWLTTMNPKDSIAGRIRLGYELIKASEVPGFEYANVKTGDYAGCIGINEMLASKLPLELYETYMSISHHEEPLSEEAAIVAEVLKQVEATHGMIGAVKLEEGTAQMGRGPAAPRFADELGES
jgi:hypothetical protein